MSRFRGPLFKYLPAQWADHFFATGELVLRNLTYFRRAAEPSRADFTEGRHIDHTGKGVTIEVPAKSLTINEDFAFVNSVSTDDIFVLCLSTCHTAELYERFGATACVEFFAPGRMLADLRASVEDWPGQWEVRHGRVEYYDRDRRVQGNIKNPRELPFFKPTSHACESEYRVTVGRAAAYTLTQRLVIGCAVDSTEQTFGAENPQSHSVTLRARLRYSRRHRRP